jgi:hypothetical protein
VPKKTASYAEVEKKKNKAEQFLRDVKGDDDRADDYGEMSVEDYAAKKHIEIVNNGRSNNRMANIDPQSMSKSELLDYVSDLEQENSDLQDSLDTIADIVAGPVEDDDGDDSDDD